MGKRKGVLNDLFSRLITKVFIIMGVIFGVLAPILAVFGVTLPENSWIYGVFLLLICFCVGLFWAFKDVHGNLQLILNKPRIIQTKSHILTDNDKQVAITLNEQMQHYHDYDDLQGILRDLEYCVDVNAILTRKCVICGRPRNEKGDGYLHAHK